MDNKYPDQDAPCLGYSPEGQPAACPFPERKIGYGMAGGGMGAYEYCSLCEYIYSKTQDQPR